MRRLNESQATVLSGTDGAHSPFFSPDGQWIAFFADGKLRKIAVSGGATVTLCDAPVPRGGDWGDDGNIVLLPARTGSLMRCSSTIPGGTQEPVGTLAEGEGTQRWPQVLLGGRAVLFTASSGDVSGYNDANLVVQRLPDGAREVVQKGGFHGRYLSSGHLAFIHDGTLFAAPFDLEELRVTGPLVPVLEGCDVTRWHRQCVVRHVRQRAICVRARASHRRGPTDPLDGSGWKDHVPSDQADGMAKSWVLARWRPARLPEH